MHPVLHIFLYNIVPIFIMILAGVYLGKKLELDIKTLTKVNFYVTVPAFTFSRLYTTELSSDKLMVAVFAVSRLLAVILLAAHGDSKSVSGKISRIQSCFSTRQTLAYL